MTLALIFPYFALSSTDGIWNNPLAAPTIILLGGIGLWKAKKLHTVAVRLQQIPVSPSIASANSGAVRLKGHIRSDHPVASPFTKTPCCYYRVEVEHEQSSDANAPSWNPIHSAASSADFLVDDASGAVRVHPEGMNLDGELIYQHDVISKPRDAQEQALFDYVKEHCPDSLNTWISETAKQAILTPEQTANPQVQERLQQWQERRAKHFQRKTKGHSYRFREFYLLPGQECEISGTLQILAGGTRLLSKSSDNVPFLLFAKDGKDLGQEQKRKALGFALVSSAFVLLGLMFLLLEH